MNLSENTNYLNKQYNTGIDIIEVKRIKDSILKFENRFLERIFTKDEIAYCESKKSQKYQSYAGRFAAKEAVFKAVSNYIENKYNIEWKDIEIINDKTGRPYVNIYGKLKETLTDISNADVSISHVEEFAMANAIAVFNRK